MDFFYAARFVHLCHELLCCPGAPLVLARTGEDEPRLEVS
jgi:hypothetical protein